MQASSDDDDEDDDDDINWSNSGLSESSSDDVDYDGNVASMFLKR